MKGSFVVNSLPREVKEVLVAALYFFSGVMLLFALGTVADHLTVVALPRRGSSNSAARSTLPNYEYPCPLCLWQGLFC